MKFLRYIPMVAIMGIIFFLSAQSGDSLDMPDIPDLDKLLHAAAYGVLALTTLYAVPEGTYRSHPWRVSLLVILFCLFYGISDEFHQSFVPGREPSLLDLIADTLGAVVAVVIWYKMRKTRRGKYQFSGKCLKPTTSSNRATTKGTNNTKLSSFFGLSLCSSCPSW